MHSLSFSLSPFSDNTASIITRRRQFSRLVQELYELPIVVWDGGEPALSGTSTLTLRVCPCQRKGRVQTCQDERGLLSSAGLSTGALIAILLCIVILLGRCCLGLGNIKPKGMEEVMGRLAGLTP